MVDRVLDGCDIREFFWVNYLYQIQPSLADERARSDEIRNQATADCLRGLGHDLPEGATWADILPVLQGLDLSAQEKCRGAAY
ncbi:hypothetical protein ON058_00880 [Demequina sp. B12]|uniref:hypothetical protein n=1 Tax=Demequina sp. B12 TaxID=2992757 RepID=UPI00237A97C6|nr:hypothetical protein [Demequina sp. B12]MDE0571967.1 hypothetical protein [Demequina sp. B12]